jgi:CelD/BcsL family acetyltransferase involved in cellulose biosynthesis
MSVSSHVEIITARWELAGLEDEWRSLAELRGNAFIAPEWFAASLEGPGANPRAFVPVVRRPDGSLRGLLPLVTTERALRTLRFAGGHFADSIHPVAAPGDEAAVASAAASALFERGAARTVLRLKHVDVAAGWLDSFLAGPPVLAAAEDERTVLPYIDLRGLTRETFLATRSPNFRGQLKRKLRNLERSPGVRFRRTADGDELESDLSVFFTSTTSAGEHSAEVRRSPIRSRDGRSPSLPGRRFGPTGSASGFSRSRAGRRRRGTAGGWETDTPTIRRVSTQPGPR